MDGTQPNAATRKRRSSILKSNRPARTPFSELEFNVATPTDTTKSRRVSFSRRTGVAEFATNEATTTWKNFYEEQNRSLELSGGQEAPPPRASVPHLGTRMFDLQFQEVEADMDFQPLGPTNNLIDNSLNHGNITQAFAMLDSIDDKPTAPQSNHELSAFTEISSKMQNDLTNPTSGTSGRINVDFSSLNPIGRDDLDDIERDLEISRPVIGPSSECSRYIELDLNSTRKTLNDSDMSITDTILSPKKEVCVKPNWVDDKENIVVNPYIAPNEEDNFAPNTSEQVLVFDGKRLTYADVNADIDEIISESLKPETKRQTIVFGENGNESDFNISMTQCVPSGLENQVKRHTIVFEKDALDADISMTQCLPATAIIVDSNAKRTVSETDVLTEAPKTKRQTIVFEKDAIDADISMTQCLPASALIEAKRTTIFGETDAPNTKRQTIVFEKDAHDADISMTQCLPSSALIEAKRKSIIFETDAPQNAQQTKRQTIVFEKDAMDADISMTQCLPASAIIDAKRTTIIPETDALQTKRQTIVFEKDAVDAEVSMTQCLPSSAIIDAPQPKRQTIVFEKDNIDADISMTQCLPSSAIIETSNVKRTTIVPDVDDLSDAPPPKRQTIVFERDAIDADISMTQCLPVSEIIEASNPKRTTIVPETDAPKTKRQTIVFEKDAQDADISMTQCLPASAIIDAKRTITDVERDTTIPKRQTIVFEKDVIEADISVTQNIPTSEIIDASKTKRTTIVGETDEPQAKRQTIVAEPDKPQPKRQTILGETDEPKTTITATDTEVSMHETNVTSQSTNRQSMKNQTLGTKFIDEFLDSTHNKTSTGATQDVDNEELAEVSVTDWITNLKSFLNKTDRSAVVDVSVLQSVPSDVSGIHNISKIDAKSDRDVSNLHNSSRIDTKSENKTISDESHILSVTNKSDRKTIYNESQMSLSNKSERKTISDVSQFLSVSTLPESDKSRIAHDETRRSYVPDIMVYQAAMESNPSNETKVETDDLQAKRTEQAEEKEKDINMSTFYTSRVEAQQNASQAFVETDKLDKDSYKSASDASKVESVEAPTSKGDEFHASSRIEPTDPSRELANPRPDRHKQEPDTKEEPITSISYTGLAPDDADASSAQESKNNVKEVKKSILDDLLDMSDITLVDDKSMAEDEPEVKEKQSDQSLFLIIRESDEKIEVNDKGLKTQVEVAPAAIEYKRSEDMNEGELQSQLKLLANEYRKSQTAPDSFENLSRTGETLQNTDTKEILETLTGFDTKTKEKPRKSVIFAGNDAEVEKGKMLELPLYEELPDEPIEMSPVETERGKISIGKATKSLRFDDDEMIEDTEHKSPLKKTAFGETSYMKDKHNVIPSYLKDVSDGIKQLMTDLVKPTADVPFERRSTLGRDASTCSTQIQANLVSSSQVELDVELTSNTSGCELLSTLAPAIADEGNNSVAKALRGIIKPVSVPASERTSYEELKPEQDLIPLKDVTPAPVQNGVLVFDPNNPLNNILLTQRDFSDAHPYNPEPSKVNEISYDVANVTATYDIEKHEVMPKIVEEVALIKPASIDCSIGVRISEVRDCEVNTTIAMRDNKELLDTSSSLTLIETRKSSANDMETEPIDFASLSERSSPIRLLYKPIDDTRKRNYSPKKSNIDVTPKPASKLQRLSKSPNSRATETIDGKRRSPKKQNAVVVQRLVTDYPSEPLLAVDSLASRTSEWPVLSNVASTASYSEPSVNVIAKIDMMPFMGTSVCEWESGRPAPDAISLQFLHSRLRFRAKLQHSPQSASRTHVRADTPLLGVDLDVLQHDKKNTLAALCVQYAADAMRHVIRCSGPTEQPTDGPKTAGELPTLVRRCAAVARSALRWGRAMYEAKLQLAYNVSEDGEISMKVANIPLRSVWQISMHIELSVDGAREVPWPRATRLHVTPLLRKDSIPGPGGRYALNTPHDWGHVPHTIWKVFRYLKNKKTDSTVELTL